MAALLEQVKKGLQKFLINIPSSSTCLNFGGRGQSLFQMNEINACGGRAKAKQTTSQKILNLIAHETGMLADLKRVREELTSMASCATTRYILLNTDFGTKKPYTCLKQDHGMEMKIDESEILTRKFDHLSKQEGFLLRKLKIAKRTIKYLLREGEGTYDSKFKDEVTRVSHQRINDCFQNMREATQYFKFLEYLHQKCDFVTHNSSSEEILKTFGKELKVEFPFLNEYVLKYGMDDHISRLQGLYEAELTYKFCLFLPSCEFRVHIPEDVDAEVALIKRSEEFQRKFSEFPDYCIEEGLVVYRQQLERKCDKDDDKWRSAYEEDLRDSFNCKKNAKLKVSNPFRDPIYKMVFHTQKQGYQMDMDGDPRTELLKLVKSYQAAPVLYSERSDLYMHYKIFDELFSPFDYEV